MSEKQDKSSACSTPEEAQKHRKKRRFTGWIVAGSILLVLGGLALWFCLSPFGSALLRVGNMFDKTVRIVAQPSTDPDATARPAVLVPPDAEISDTAPSDEALDAELIDDEESAAPQDIYKRASIDANVVNILILGQDGVSYQEASNRTDVMLLLSYNRATNEAKLVSFQRDAYVPIVGRKNWNRLNTCYHFGGAGLAVNTFNELFDLDIQYYVTLAFSEFKQLVDAVGGIDLTITSLEANNINSACPDDAHVKEGLAHLTGQQALQFCRNRSTGTGDWGRAERQRRFMLALYQKVRANFDLNMATELINYASDYIRTNIPFSLLYDLAKTVVVGEEVAVQNTRVPFDDTWHYASKNVASVIVFDIETNAQLLYEYLYGTN